MAVAYIGSAVELAVRAIGKVGVVAAFADTGGFIKGVIGKGVLTIGGNIAVIVIPQSVLLGIIRSLTTKLLHLYCP